ncbi:MAG: YceD family protein [Blastocatellia bacterium]
MILSLVRFPPDGLVFEHLYGPGELDPGSSDLLLTSAPVVKSRIDRVGHNFRLRGSLQCTITRPCDRCLAEVSLPLDINFDLLYAPAEELEDRTGEVELGEQDLDLSVFQHDQIDLDALVVEQIELQVPIQLLCREECRGLCPECGADWNVETCSCTPPIDPRWETLMGVLPVDSPEEDPVERGSKPKRKRNS